MNILIQFAQRISAGQNNIPTLTADQILTNVLNTFYFIVGAVAVIVIIFAGINYALSGGDSGKVTRAKNMILYAIIGLIIILSAYAITNFVIRSF